PISWPCRLTNSVSARSVHSGRSDNSSAKRDNARSSSGTIFAELWATSRESLGKSLFNTVKATKKTTIAAPIPRTMATTTPRVRANIATAVAVSQNSTAPYRTYREREHKIFLQRGQENGRHSRNAAPGNSLLHNGQIIDSES